MRQDARHLDDLRRREERAGGEPESEPQPAGENARRPATTASAPAARARASRASSGSPPSRSSAQSERRGDETAPPGGRRLAGRRLEHRRDERGRERRRGDGVVEVQLAREVAREGVDRRRHPGRGRREPEGARHPERRAEGDEPVQPEVGVQRPERRLPARAPSEQQQDCRDRTAGRSGCPPAPVRRRAADRRAAARTGAGSRRARSGRAGGSAGRRAG